MADFILTVVLVALLIALYCGLGLIIFIVVEDAELFKFNLKDYRIGLIVFWPLFLIVLLAKGIFDFVKFTKKIITELKC